MSGELFFITCGCAKCGDRMKLTSYEPGKHNIRGYTEGWKCDKCDFDSVNMPGAPRSKIRFYCGNGGCHADLCILCGRRKMPVFELHVGMGERTYPAEFITPTLKGRIDSAEQTMTGSGATYRLQFEDQNEEKWELSFRYSELEKLHMALEEVTWSADRPGDVPFPPKEMFPNVERRKLMFARYLKALMQGMPKLAEQYQAKIVEFFGAMYYPSQPSSNLPSQGYQIASSPTVGEMPEANSAPVTKDIAIPIRQTPHKLRELRCPSGTCNSTMQHTEYTAGDHNLAGYRNGWQCDSCQFLSTDEPNSQKARYRYHCSVCLQDYCITCGDKFIEDSNTPGREPYLLQTPTSLSYPSRGRDSVSARTTSQTMESPTVVKLREAKTLLEEGLIQQNDYDELKRRVMDELMPSRAQ